MIENPCGELSGHLVTPACGVIDKHRGRDMALRGPAAASNEYYKLLPHGEPSVAPSAESVHDRLAA